MTIPMNNAGFRLQGTSLLQPFDQDWILCLPIEMMKCTKKAVLDAVYLANERKRETRLSYLEENASFLVTTTSGIILEQHKVYQEITEKIRSNTDLIPKVFFKAIGPLSGVDGDFTKIDDDLLALKSVRFHAGVGTPFSVEISFRGKLEKFTFDPFSGYMIDPEEIE